MDVTGEQIDAITDAITALDAEYPDGLTLEHDRRLAELLGQHGFIREQWAVLQGIIEATAPAFDIDAIEQSKQVFLTLEEPEGAIEYLQGLQSGLPVWQLGTEQTGIVTVDPYANWRYDASVENLELAQTAGLSRIVPVLQDNVEYYAGNLENSPANVVGRLLVMPGQ